MIYNIDDSRGRYNYSGNWENGKRQGQGKIKGRLQAAVFKSAETVHLTLLSR